MCTNDAVERTKDSFCRAIVVFFLLHSCPIPNPPLSLGLSAFGSLFVYVCMRCVDKIYVKRGKSLPIVNLWCLCVVFFLVSFVVFVTMWCVCVCILCSCGFSHCLLLFCVWTLDYTKPETKTCTHTHAADARHFMSRSKIGKRTDATNNSHIETRTLTLSLAHKHQNRVQNCLWEKKNWNRIMKKNKEHKNGFGKMSRWI